MQNIQYFASYGVGAQWMMDFLKNHCLLVLFLWVHSFFFSAQEKVLKEESEGKFRNEGD